MDILSTLNTGGSGLNIAELSKTLSSSEIEPRKKLVSDRIDRAELSLTGLERVRVQVEAMQKALGFVGQLQLRQVSSSQPAAVAATITAPQAIADRPSTVTVSQLAQGQVLSFGGFATADAPMGAGALTLDFGAWSGDTPPQFSANAAQTPQQLEFSATATLADVAAALNDVPGVQARVVDLGDGSFALGVISETGANNALRLTAQPGASAALAALDISAGPGAAMVQQAQDAVLSVDGIAVTRPSNQIDDLLPGLSLELRAPTTGTATVAPSVDLEGAEEVMQGFVDALNATHSLLQGVTARGFGAAQEAGELAGDQLIIGVMRQMQSVLAQGYGAGGQVHLGQLGLETQRDGTMVLNAETFRKALSENPALLQPLLSNSTSTNTAGAQLLTQPGANAVPGTHSLSIDTDTGVARIGRLVFSGDTQPDGSIVFNFATGPLQGASLQVPAGTTDIDVSFGHGLLETLGRTLQDTLAADGGLDQRETAVKDGIAEETEMLDTLARKAAELEARYLRRFTEMERIVTQLNSTGDYLTNLIDAWNSDN